MIVEIKSAGQGTLLGELMEKDGVHFGIRDNDWQENCDTKKE